VVSLDSWVAYFEYLQLLGAEAERIEREFTRRNDFITKKFHETAQKHKKIFVTQNRETSQLKRKELRRAAALAYAVDLKASLL